MPDDINGLPVLGYRAQPTTAIDLVNANKQIEETTLRILDTLAELGPDIDQRMLAIGRTAIEQGFMWANRSIFRPARVKLPDDGV